MVTPLWPMLASSLGTASPVRVLRPDRVDHQSARVLTTETVPS